MHFIRNKRRCSLIAAYESQVREAFQFHGFSFRFTSFLAEMLLPKSCNSYGWVIIFMVFFIFLSRENEWRLKLWTRFPFEHSNQTMLNFYRVAWPFEIWVFGFIIKRCKYSSPNKWCTFKWCQDIVKRRQILVRLRFHDSVFMCLSVFFPLWNPLKQRITSAGLLYYII